ncbi:epidermal growth factor receptor kinase substrate 8-like protein 1a [Synchiropus splendidus]|uniref:epidermal growth factor receptor kinase substrate 8-like protein 1a n=1 Tax=Synchiropus splendidus TaxID=270530 RepID=UPI00237E0380|nr:epidermal growth factor receptor kinase substrate 8-like protein 1a [Synchiropus splendidus]XP_053707176.1 epidermal growth factor receptor kinase substrate 8-like protein 1a [Synchiropus splendidus]
MSAPPVVPRKPSGVKVMPGPGGHVIYREPAVSEKVTDATEKSYQASELDAEREVEIINHCFDDVERFMMRLQQTADAQSVLNQRKSKRSRKGKKKNDQDDDLLAMKAQPPSEEEFTDIFQKIKYSLCLLDRLKSLISQPDAPTLLHHVFVPLRLMVKTTGDSTLAASVLSPAMTSGAVSFLQDNLTADEKQLWTSLGPNWNSPRSQLSVSVPPYSPVFLDRWQPPAVNSSGRSVEDPVESQHKQEAFREHLERQRVQVSHTEEHHGEQAEEVDGAPPEGERLYCCSYDFVARNSSELSVQQGETLEVLDSSKRWWKCRNRYDQIGFIPSNILEPLSALSSTERGSELLRRESTKTSLSPRSKYFSYAAPSSDGTSPTATSPTMRPQSMVLPSLPLQGDNGNKVLIMNDELLERLAGKKGSSRALVVPRSAGSAAPLNYHSSASEVETWLSSKGFSPQTVQSLGILNAAQLFSLKKEELRRVSPQEGVKVYSQIMMQKALLEDERRATELEKAMERQKQKIALE